MEEIKTPSPAIDDHIEERINNNTVTQLTASDSSKEEIGDLGIELGTGHDVPSHLFQPLLDHGLNVGSDGLICWAQQNQHHPRNWSRLRKIYDIGIIIFLDFFTYVPRSNLVCSWSLTQVGISSAISTAGVSILLTYARVVSDDRRPRQPTRRKTHSVWKRRYPSSSLYQCKSGLTLIPYSRRDRLLICLATSWDRESVPSAFHPILRLSEGKSST